MCLFLRAVICVLLGRKTRKYDTLELLCRVFVVLLGCADIVVCSRCSRCHLTGYFPERDSEPIPKKIWLFGLSIETGESCKVPKSHRTIYDMIRRVSGLQRKIIRGFYIHRRCLPVILSNCFFCTNRSSCIHEAALAGVQPPQFSDFDSEFSCGAFAEQN